MTIKSNISNNVIDIGIVDTLVLSVNSNERIGINGFSVHHTGITAEDITVSIYNSPDNTTASGKRVAVVTLRDGESSILFELAGQGLSDIENIVAIADLEGCNIKASFTQYFGDSV